MHLETQFAAIFGALDAQRIRYAICGEFGRRILGDPAARPTLDVELLVEPASLTRVAALWIAGDLRVHPIGITSESSAAWDQRGRLRWRHVDLWATRLDVPLRSPEHPIDYSARAIVSELRKLLLSLA
jgi:hypothetical protein